MPSTELTDRLDALMRKVETLRGRYLALQSENKELARTIERQKLELAQQEKELQRLRVDNEFLCVARSIAPDPEAVARYKKQVANMVRDIDRCIKQLNA